MPGLHCTHPLYSTIMLVCVSLCLSQFCWQSGCNQSIVRMAVNMALTRVSFLG